MKLNSNSREKEAALKKRRGPVGEVADIGRQRRIIACKLYGIRFLESDDVIHVDRLHEAFNIMIAIISLANDMEEEVYLGRGF